ncbi:MAG: SPASM domain-containing protein [Myxococcales bacterium]|nr:SPASM domain-containing protein [Myxococcales bacterium]
MDPYIDSSALDANHPLTSRKLQNLVRANVSHASRDQIVDAWPSKITLQTTDACNLDCPHCQIPRSRKTPRMDRTVLDAVVRELFPTLIELHPTNVGEPFAWPLFRELCLQMEKHGVLLDLTTNGTLLDDARIDWIAPIARDVKVSMDGAQKETFERLRRGAQFDAVCANVRALVNRLAAVTIRRPIVALQMTLMRSNVCELPALVELAAALGVPRVRAYHLFSFSADMDAEAIVAEPTLWQPVADRAQELALRLGVQLQIAEPAAQTTEAVLQRVACHLPWHEAWIDYDGAVLPCHSHGGDQAGNIMQTDFSEIWNGPLYQRIRRGFAEDRPSWHCDGCGMCYRRLNRSTAMAVPYDAENFLSTAPPPRSDLMQIRWSGRMRPFDLTGRR